MFLRATPRIFCSLSAWIQATEGPRAYRYRALTTNTIPNTLSSRNGTTSLTLPAVWKSRWNISGRWSRRPGFWVSNSNRSRIGVILLRNWTLLKVNSIWHNRKKMIPNISWTINPCCKSAPAKRPWRNRSLKTWQRTSHSTSSWHPMRRPKNWRSSVWKTISNIYSNKSGKTVPKSLKKCRKIVRSKRTI